MGTALESENPRIVRMFLELLIQYILEESRGQLNARHGVAMALKAYPVLLKT